MKKLSILLMGTLLTSFILILSGCAPGQVTVYSSDGNVSISVPSGWNTNDTIITKIFPAAIIGASDIANQEYVAVIGLPKSYLGANSTVNDFLAQIKKSSVTTISNPVWGNPSSVTINGLNGLTVQVTGTLRINNTPSTFLVNALENNNYFYAVVGFTSTSLLPANRATLQSIINSFEAPATTHTGGWKPYTYPWSVILFFILLIVGIGLFFLGRRIKSKIRVPHPGRVLKIVMVTVWVLLIAAFLSVVLINRSNRSGSGTGIGPIFPITLACAAVTFIYLVYISRRDGILPALGNGFVGAAAGPMVFEFFFDLIVIPQINATATFLAAYFGTLDFAVLLTLSLLLLPRRVFITRYSIYALGAMFVVFAVWAWFGFAYPSTPISFTLNAISKVLSFVTVALLFTTEKVISSAKR